MEKVQFQLEATLPELKDLHEKGLFSKHEIDQITRRRTHFETSLIRKGIRKEDFFKYAEYEINLEKLRKIRWKRLGYDKNPPPPSASLYSIPRRTMYILKRATAKFPGDIATWLAYVEYAGREGMRKIVAKGLTSALQHHPLSPTLYLLSSFHHVHPGSPFPRSAIPSTSKLDLPSAAAEVNTEDASGTFALEGTQSARTTLLLGLRMLPKNHELWREYIKLELGWVEALRRRWKVLGIANTERPLATRENGEEVAGGAGSFGPDGEDARKAILGGQLVMQAIHSALAATRTDKAEDGADGLDFREGLLAVLRIYPSPIRNKCLELVYAELDDVAGTGGRSGARARLLSLTRNLFDRRYEAGRKDDGSVVLSDVELVEELGRIGKDLRRGVKAAGPDFGEVAGQWLDERIRENEGNVDLSTYLLSVLASIARPSLNPSAALLLTHLKHAEKTASPAEYRDLARKSAALHPDDPRLQLTVLRSEVAASDESATIRAIAERLVKSFDQSSLSQADKDTVREIWGEWIGWEISARPRVKEMEQTWSKILRLSLSSVGSPHIHNDLLTRYFKWLLRDDASGVMIAVKRISATYRPSSTFYASALGALISSDASLIDLMRLHEAWRVVCSTESERADEALAIATILLRQNKAKEAVQVIGVAKSEIKNRPEALKMLEMSWKAMLDEMEAEQAEEDSDEGDDNGEDEGTTSDGLDLGIIVDVGDVAEGDDAMGEEDSAGVRVL